MTVRKTISLNKRGGGGKKKIWFPILGQKGCSFFRNSWEKGKGEEVLELNPRQAEKGKDAVAALISVDQGKKKCLISAKTVGHSLGIVSGGGGRFAVFLESALFFGGGVTRRESASGRTPVKSGSFTIFQKKKCHGNPFRGLLVDIKAKRRGLTTFPKKPTKRNEERESTLFKGKEGLKEALSSKRGVSTHVPSLSRGEEEG